MPWHGRAGIDEDHRFALCIVADDYDDSDLQQVAAPAADFSRLVEVLADPKVGGFVAPTVLRNRPAGELEMAVEAFFSGRTPEDTLLVYLCGVAVVSKGGLYFAATDTRLRAPAPAALAAEFLDGAMRRCDSTSIVVILDCAYTSLSARPGDHAEVARLLLSGPGRALLTSSPVLRRSAPASNRVSPTVVTEEIVSALQSRETDSNDDGRITADELFDRVRDEVERVAPTRCPEIYDSGVARSLVLAVTRSKPAVTGTFNAQSTPATIQPLARATAQRVIEPSHPIKTSPPAASSSLGGDPWHSLQRSTTWPLADSRPVPLQSTSPPSGVGEPPYRRPAGAPSSRPRPPRRLPSLTTVIVTSALVLTLVGAGTLYAVLGAHKPTSKAGGDHNPSLAADGTASATVALPHQPLIFPITADIPADAKRSLQSDLDKLGYPTAGEIKLVVTEVYRDADPSTTTAAGAHAGSKSEQSAGLIVQLFLRNGLDRTLDNVDLRLTLDLGTCDYGSQRQILAASPPDTHFTPTDGAPSIPPGVTLFTAVHFAASGVKDFTTDLSTYQHEKKPFCSESDFSF